MASCSLVINGQSVKANIGETLVDAALGGWVIVPHDCTSGQCGTCRVTVLGGAVDDQGTAEGRTVLACQALVTGDAEVAFDEVPQVIKRAGTISEITRLGPDVVEVVVALASPIEYRAGQYFSVKFAGFPARDLSPSVRWDGTLGRAELVFHIRRYPGGIVSTQIGATIRAGHRVQVRGPFGQAFLRDGDGPIVLVAGGTGWAPIWSIASEALRTQRHRELLVIAGARDAGDLYMLRSLDRLIDDGALNVVATAETGAIDPILPGRPTHYLPSLGLDDTVYVAGPPGLVDAVKRKARQARARCYADPFLPGAQKLSFVDRIMQMLRRPADATAAASIPMAAGSSFATSVSQARGSRIDDARAASTVPVSPTQGVTARERSKA